MSVGVGEAIKTWAERRNERTTELRIEGDGMRNNLGCFTFTSCFNPFTNGRPPRFLKRGRNTTTTTRHASNEAKLDLLNLLPIKTRQRGQ